MITERAFQLKLSDSLLNKLIASNEQNTTYNKKYNHDKEIINKLLESSLNNEYRLDGTSLQMWAFSQNKHDIFLSHSHKDIDKVKRLAGWLENEFGLKVFVDSLVWMNCDDILRGIDDIYCKRENSDLYSYEKRNYSTSHVHMMLATALAEVMDRSRCVIFYNTPNSISIRNTEKIAGNRDNDEKQITSSPWIYYEINMIKLIKPKPGIKMYNSLYEKRDLHVDYDVTGLLNQIYPLNEEIISKWHVIWSEQKDDKEDALRVLYELWYESMPKTSSPKKITF